MSLTVVKAPKPWSDSAPSLFLAGGISGCPGWQEVLTANLQAAWRASSWTILNPRRDDWPGDESAAAREQIEWEFRALRAATAIVFWFPCETLCPITLFELGAWTRSDKALFIGVHPDYGRRFDVEVQTALARPELTIVDNLEALGELILKGMRRAV